MKGGKRTSKGRLINIDDVIAAAPHSTAVGNMRVNAQGDTLGSGGEVLQTREQRTRAYYKDHPQASNKQVSLKGADMSQMATAMDQQDFAGLKPDTTDTAYENARTSTSTSGSQSEVVTDESPAEPEEFDVPEPEPTGFREVELDNGDIEMQPYWDDEDTEQGDNLA